MLIGNIDYIFDFHFQHQKFFVAIGYYPFGFSPSYNNKNSNGSLFFQMAGFIS